MNDRLLRLLICLVLFMVTLLGASMVNAAEERSEKLLLSGMRMQLAEDGSVQGFLDIALTNVVSKGVNFTLQYDQNYVQISNAATNKPAGDTLLDLWLVEPYVNMESDDFVWQDTDEQVRDIGVTGMITKNANTNYAKAEFSIYVNNNAVGPNIIDQTLAGDTGTSESTKVMDAMGKKLHLCSISFRVENPGEVTKLTDEELSNMFRICTDETGASVFQISYVDNTKYPPTVYYNTDEHLSYSFAVENSLAAVKVLNDGQTTNAAEIFNRGTVDDLLCWMNSNMQDVSARYIDGTSVSSTVEWGQGAEGVDYTVTPEYNPKGGTYKVVQKYNDRINAVANVTVVPVTAKGFVCEDDYINYWTVDDIPNGEDAIQVLKLPVMADVIFDVEVPGKTTSLMVGIDGNSWKCLLPDGEFAADLLDIRNGAEGVYTFAANVMPLDGDELFPAWVTDGTEADKVVQAVRTLGEATAEPGYETDFTASVTDDGWLIVDVNNVGGETSLTGYLFDLRLPCGLVPDISMFDSADSFKVEYPAEGGAKISIKAEDGSSRWQQQVLRQSINLGKKLGKFALAATAPDKQRSNWAEFATEPRRNFYKPGNGEGGVYEFDFSDVPQMISVDKGATLKNTIVLPLGNVVDITYSGRDGLEPGRLSTIAVDGWQTEDAMEIGGVVTFTGTLANGHLYADNGKVYNSDAVTVKLTLMVKDPENPPEEKIGDLTDVVFAKTQQGYRDKEVHEIVVLNKGKNDIEGLWVEMTPDAGSEDAFALGAAPAYKLAAGGQVAFTIERNLGLTKGAYGATVSVGTNRSGELKTFRVSVTIVGGPVYKVNIAVEPESSGTGVAVNGDAYEPKENVTLKAEPIKDSNGDTDYRFDSWTVMSDVSGVEFTPNANATEVTFTMPDLAVEMPNAVKKELEIKAAFEPTPAASLRLNELHLLNPDKSENDLLLWNEQDAKYEKVEFDALQRSYIVITPSSAETNNVEFALLNSADMDKVEITPYWNDVEMDASSMVYDSSTGKGVITTPALETAPVVNKLKIKLTRTDGADERAYEVQIKRKLSAEEMADMNYGNSPFGLIMKDGISVEERKSKFRENNCFVSGYTPSGAAGKEGIKYHPDAWGDSGFWATLTRTVIDPDKGNYDRNDYALFVYQGDMLVDPGINGMKNSLGEAVDVSKVTKVIYGLNSMETVSDNLVDVFRQGTSLEPMILDGTNRLDARIRPGVYHIGYEFEDYNGETTAVNRPLIVLYQLGDVNMDGNVSDDDAAYIANRYNKLLPSRLSGYESNCRIYQCRVCDANRDRNINVGDRNAIRSAADFVQFYK